MNLDNTNRWLTLAANIGVIAGIIFLAVEINQSTLQTRLQTASSFHDTFTTVELSLAANNDLLEALLKSQKGEDLSEVDRLRVLVFYRAVLRGYQNTFYQSRTGVIDPAVWEGERNQMKQSFGFDQGMVSYWLQNRSLYSPDFNTLISSLIEEIGD